MELFAHGSHFLTDSHSLASALARMRLESHRSPGVFQQIWLAFRWGLTYRLYTLASQIRGVKMRIEVRWTILRFKPTIHKGFTDSNGRAPPCIVHHTVKFRPRYAVDIPWNFRVLTIKPLRISMAQTPSTNRPMNWIVQRHHYINWSFYLGLHQVDLHLSTVGLCHQMPIRRSCFCRVPSPSLRDVLVFVVTFCRSLYVVIKQSILHCTVFCFVSKVI
ncbi:hypothetical protein EDB83DRAFT_636368 [Lactarius deliciosus]|nr:hypothetical protein EDB83DRAFT_636368 [Lactarius deliciosus]